MKKKTEPDLQQPCGDTQTTNQAQQPQEQCDTNGKTINAAPCSAQELEKLCAQRDSYLEMAQRIQAEFDNYRRRTQSTRAEALEEGKQAAVLGMLPVLDNFERALCAMQDALAAQDPMAQGVERIATQFADTLSKLGVEEIPALNQAFDPNLHEAVLCVPETLEAPAGQVVQVMQKGYRIGEKVLRHTIVAVSS